MNWTAGYASDVEYVAGFYREQSPAWLNYVALLNGAEPLDLSQPYTYCELGCGRGLTALVLAAGNPQGQFYAADFNPSHVAGASRLAAQAGLDNLSLLENSFEELANGDVELPQFDFITLHGVYTWVTAECRQHIVKFIGRYLKPGGLVFVSYNAMPGCTAALPLQRLLVEYADVCPGRSDTQLKEAAALIKQLQQANAGYLTQHPSLKARIDNLSVGNPHYLVHEYMHKHWQPLYHADVARDLEGAKLNFLGTGDLSLAFPALFLDDSRRALIDKAGRADMRETLKDYFLNTVFRRDVFARGSVHAGAVRQAELLEQVGVLLVVPPGKASLTMKLTPGEFSGREDLYRPLLDALAKRPHTLAELTRLPTLQPDGPANVAQAVSLLCASNQTAFYFPPSAGAVASAARLNRVLAAQVRYDDVYSALCSPLLGSGVAAGYVERALYLALQGGVDDQSPSALVRFVWRMMESTPRRMQRDGAVLQSVDDNLAELRVRVDDFLANTLPLWRQLQVI